MYAGIFVLAVALIALVLWVSRISSKLTALKQALMIEQRKVEELERQLGIETPYDRLFDERAQAAGSERHAEADGRSKEITLKRGKRQDQADISLDGSTGEIDLIDAYGYDGADADEGMMMLGDAQSLRQQEQMRRVSRARERQAKLKQKHSEEQAAELRRKQEIARRRDEQVRTFQKQQEALRQRIAQEEAERAAEEERLNKLRMRASWSSPGSASPRPRQRSSSVRLEERRQAQLRKQAEEILQTRLGNAGETNHFGNSDDIR